VNSVGRNVRLLCDWHKTRVSAVWANEEFLVLGVVHARVRNDRSSLKVFQFVVHLPGQSLADTGLLFPNSFNTRPSVTMCCTLKQALSG
jgi:hypothetical protein